MWKKTKAKNPNYENSIKPLVSEDLTPLGQPSINNAAEEDDLFDKDDFVQTKLEPSQQEVDSAIEHVLEKKKSYLERIAEVEQKHEQESLSIKDSLIESERIKQIEITEAQKILDQSEIFIVKSNKDATLIQEEALKKVNALKADALNQKNQSILLANKLQEQSLKRAEALKQLALKRIKLIEINKQKINHLKKLEIQKIELEIEKARQEAKDHIKHSNKIKRNLELLIHLKDEELSMLANENDISLPDVYTRKQKIEALKHIDATSSGALRTLLVLEQQKQRIIQDSIKERELTQELNQKKLWAIKEGKKIQKKFEEDYTTLSNEETMVEQAKENLTTNKYLKMSSQEIDDIAEQLKKTLEIKLNNIKDIK